MSDLEKVAALLTSAIDRQTEALKLAVRGEDDLSIEERALIVLSRDNGEIDSLAKLARTMGLASSCFYKDNERNLKVKRLFESLQGNSVRKGFQTTQGVEVAQ